MTKLIYFICIGVTTKFELEQEISTDIMMTKQQYPLRAFIDKIQEHLHVPWITGQML